MSGHSKWSTIKNKKGVADSKRGKIFTKHAKLIYISARDGGVDPDMNPNLRTAILNAKADNVPNVNIDKALKKASGDKGGAKMEEIMYEGFGPDGTAFYIQSITDNKNRSFSSIKTAFTKSGGTMGSAGSVAWMFEKKGIILAKNDSVDQENAELLAIDAGCEDIYLGDEFYEIITDATDLMKVRSNLENAGFEVKKSEQSFIAKEQLNVEDLEVAKKLIHINESVEDLEDVDTVYSNFDIDDSIVDQL